MNRTTLQRAIRRLRTIADRLTQTEDNPKPEVSPQLRREAKLLSRAVRKAALLDPIDALRYE